MWFLIAAATVYFAASFVILAFKVELSKLVTDAFKYNWQIRLVLGSEFSTAIAMFAGLFTPPLADNSVMNLLAAAHVVLIVWLCVARADATKRAQWALALLFGMFAVLFTLAGSFYSHALGGARQQLSGKHVLMWLHVAHRTLVDGWYTWKMLHIDLDQDLATASVI